MKWFCRCLEELLPFVFFVFNKKRILKRISNYDEWKKDAKKYTDLDEGDLKVRITQEHERGVKIDEKTFKFTLGLSVSLTVLAAASGTFVKFMPDTSFRGIISIICGLAALYMLAAGITALGAIKTLPTFGYGTAYLINLKNDATTCLTESLYCQEQMNIVRHLRNESAFQALRNGFFLLFLALIISIISVCKM